MRPRGLRHTAYGTDSLSVLLTTVVRPDEGVPSAHRSVVPLARRAGAEALGSALLAAVVIGSGIAAQRLSPGDLGLQLLENAAATGVGLYAIILMVGPVSGAHLNPVVSLVDAALGGLAWRDVPVYATAQALGCAAGAVLANAMFALPPVTVATTDRLTGATALAEVVATAALILVIFATVRSGRATSAPAAVGATIAGAYFWTSSTSFANPAITLGRTLSDTFAGIAPASAPGFMAAQLAGGAVGYGLVRLLYPRLSASEAASAVVAHPAHPAPPTTTKVSP